MSIKLKLNIRSIQLNSTWNFFCLFNWRFFQFSAFNNFWCWDFVICILLPLYRGTKKSELLWCEINKFKFGSQDQEFNHYLMRTLTLAWYDHPGKWKRNLINLHKITPSTWKLRKQTSLFLKACRACKSYFLQTFLLIQ